MTTIPITQKRSRWLGPLLAMIAFWPAWCQGESEGVFADFETSAGNFTCRLETTLAPKAAAHFIGLVTGERAWLDWRSGAVRAIPFYDGFQFTHVTPEVLIQAGSPAGPIGNNPGYVFPVAADATLRFDGPGMLALARSDTDGNGAEFFSFDTWHS